MTIDIKKLAIEAGFGEALLTRPNVPEKLLALCEAYAAKVLEDKEREIAEMENTLQKIVEVLVAGADLNESYRKTIDAYEKANKAALEEKTQARHDEALAYKHYHELKTHINILREALTASDNLLRELPSSGGFFGLAIMENNQLVLSKTPAQHINDDVRIFTKDSLQEHDNEVIERIAYTFNDEPDAVRIMNKIRALKGKQNG